MYENPPFRNAQILHLKISQKVWAYGARNWATFTSNLPRFGCHQPHLILTHLYALFPDGANGIKYNLTADIIESIFKTYPAVKRKHLENVPSKMKEQEFW